MSFKVLAILLANLSAAGAFKTWNLMPILEAYEHMTLKEDFFVEACCFAL